VSTADFFTEYITSQMADGNTPADYDMRPGAKIMSTVIDNDYAGRAWTYQVCTEFGWF